MADEAVAIHPDDAKRQAIETVTALYRALLLRDPDKAGLDGWSNRLLQGHTDLKGLVGAILRSAEFAQRSGAILLHYAHPGSARFTNDNSQFGETWLLLRSMVNRAARHRILVDVGARGSGDSNSYDLMRHFGWRGVLIDANPHRLEPIRREFEGLDASIVHSAVSDYEGEAEFYVGGVASLSQAFSARFGELRDKVRVRVQRLGSILQAHAVPNDFDFLSIDAEGEDVTILNDVVAAGYAPGWVTIEAAAPAGETRLGPPFSAEVTALYEVVDRTAANLILRVRASA